MTVAGEEGRAAEAAGGECRGGHAAIGPVFSALPKPREGEELGLEITQGHKETILPGSAPLCTADSICISREENELILASAKPRALADSDADFLSFLQ